MFRYVYDVTRIASQIIHVAVNENHNLIWLSLVIIRIVLCDIFTQTLLIIVATINIETKYATL